jgi:hypothetical protein
MAMTQPDNTTVEGGLQHLLGWERRGNENLASLAEGGLIARDFPLADRIPKLDQPARPA